MKKIVFFAVAVLLVNISMAQEIKFKLYGFNRCDKKISVLSFYSLKSNKVYTPKDTNGICVLPDTGSYKLNAGNEIRTYHFDKFKLYIDTVEIMPLEFLIAHDHSGRSAHYYCGELAQGKYTLHFANGKLLAKGCFVNGQAKGTVMFYYSNGQIQEIKKYRRNGKFLWSKEFDEYGKLVSSSSNKMVKIK